MAGPQESFRCLGLQLCMTYLGPKPDTHCGIIILAILRSLYSYIDMKFLHYFQQRVTPEPLNGKTWFQSHIVEQHKSY